MPVNIMIATNLSVADAKTELGKTAFPEGTQVSITESNTESGVLDAEGNVVQPDHQFDDTPKKP